MAGRAHVHHGGIGGLIALRELRARLGEFPGLVPTAVQLHSKAHVIVRAIRRLDLGRPIDVA